MIEKYDYYDKGYVYGYPYVIFVMNAFGFDGSHFNVYNILKMNSNIIKLFKLDVKYDPEGLEVGKVYMYNKVDKIECIDLHVTMCNIHKVIEPNCFHVILSIQFKLALYDSGMTDVNGVICVIQHV